MTTKLFLITAQTNLHVGSGDSNYGIIDNLVQRDPITTLPHINSSSMKGALREFYEEGLVKKEEAKVIFGSEPKPTDKNTQKGNHNFFEGHLLAMPVASNVGAFFLATTAERIQHLVNTAKTFGVTVNINIPPVNDGKPKVYKQSAGVQLGDFGTENDTTTGQPALEKYFGNHPIALFSEQDFQKLCDDAHLPVIARNQLENGVSKNLWYEQIVPREARFFTIIQEPDTHSISADIKDKIVQIGANATVGYGYSLFTLLNA